jgi:hypothetical protein
MFVLFADAMTNHLIRDEVGRNSGSVGLVEGRRELAKFDFTIRQNRTPMRLSDTLVDEVPGTS